jgi:hypothetical protein
MELANRRSVPDLDPGAKAGMAPQRPQSEYLGTNYPPRRDHRGGMGLSGVVRQGVTTFVEQFAQ